MKIAIIGGAGVRVPLLVGGFARSDLDDRSDRALRHRPAAPRRDRRPGRADGPRRAGERARAPEPCIDGADFVITSIRVGGAAQRATDEATAIAHGVVGQETVGPAGFAMAVRTIPPMVEYARLAARLAPHGVAHQLHQPGQRGHAGRAPGDRRAGHRHLRHAARRCSKTPRTRSGCRRPRASTTTSASTTSAGCARSSSRANRRCIACGTTTRARCRAIARRCSSTSGCASMRLLPTEYLYYYYRPDMALANMQRAGTSRGQAVAGLTEQFFADLAAGAADPVGALSAVPGRARRQLHAARNRQHHAAHQARLGGAVRLRQHRAHDHRGHRRQHGRRDPARRRQPRHPAVPRGSTTSSRCRAPWTRTDRTPQPVATVPDHCARAHRAREGIRTRHGHGGA